MIGSSTMALAKSREHKTVTGIMQGPYETCNVLVTTLQPLCVHGACRTVACYACNAQPITRWCSNLQSCATGSLLSQLKPQVAKLHYIFIAWAARHQKPSLHHNVMPSRHCGGTLVLLISQPKLYHCKRVTTTELAMFEAIFQPMHTIPPVLSRPATMCIAGSLLPNLS